MCDNCIIHYYCYNILIIIDQLKSVIVHFKTCYFFYSLYTVDAMEDIFTSRMKIRKVRNKHKVRRNISSQCRSLKNGRWPARGQWCTLACWQPLPAAIICQMLTCKYLNNIQIKCMFLQRNVMRLLLLIGCGDTRKIILSVLPTRQIMLWQLNIMAILTYL